MSELALPPLASTAAYPEQAVERPGIVDRLADRLVAPVARRLQARKARDPAIVEATRQFAKEAEKLSDAGVKKAAAELRLVLRRDGFTVPAHVPGEARGSCSFASEADRPLPQAMLPLAQLAGNFAFAAARRLWTGRGGLLPRPGPALTDRQRDCVLWVARGKGDWEISRILGISEETVARHIKQACERYGVNKRTLLVIRTLFDGTLTFSDIFRRRYAPFRA